VCILATRQYPDVKQTKAADRQTGCWRWGQARRGAAREEKRETHQWILISTTKARYTAVLGSVKRRMDCNVYSSKVEVPTNSR
jgi:hypothetical protein